MADRIVTGTLDTFSVDSGSDVTYKGAGVGNDTGLSQRAFEVNPGTTGNITVTLDRSSGVVSMEIFQSDDHSAGSAPAGYKKAFNVAQAGKGKGAVGVTVTDATKNYIVLLKLDGYSEVSYNALVVVP
tara:strand:+ start:90 stop:473 length:384 start_codon:yes stop_codon:yes gene_type:complete